MLKVGVSLLSKKGLDLQEYVNKARNADFLHFDIIDSKYAPNTGLEISRIADIKSDLKRVFHLMVLKPEHYLSELENPYLVYFHPETTENPEKLIKELHSKGIKAGIALTLDKEAKYLEIVDAVLVMSIVPGRSGQTFIPNALDKIKEIRAKFKGLIEVDGGINPQTAKLVAEAGADIVNSDSFIWNSEDPEKAVEILKNSG